MRRDYYHKKSTGPEQRYSDSDGGDGLTIFADRLTDAPDVLVGLLRFVGQPRFAHLCQLFCQHIEAGDRAYGHRLQAVWVQFLSIGNV